MGVEEIGMIGRGKESIGGKWGEGRQMGKGRGMNVYSHLNGKMGMRADGQRNIGGGIEE